MTQTVFAQLGMGSTSYYHSFGAGRLARGHLYLLGFAMPMPYGPIPQPNTANLICSTAPYLARFLAELISPRYLDKNGTAQMLLDQVLGRIGAEPISWGLGIGLYHTSRGTCFWQWGSTSDFKSYILGCPDTRMV